MAKKVLAVVRLQAPAGQATPAPPVGPALGQHGVNIVEFCKQFNVITKNQQSGITIPVVLTVYKDRTFTFIVKNPPVPILLKQAAGLAKGSGEPNRTKVGKITRQAIKEIAMKKMTDLNTNKIESAMKVVEGTARGMGLTVEE